MITESNGKPWWASTIRWATSYCAALPVPISPMAAKRTELDLSGSLNSPARRPGARRKRRLRNRKMRRRMVPPGDSRFNGDNLGNQIDHEIGFIVQQNQIATHDAVHHFRRQLRKLEQQSRRDGGVRNSLR